jgi:protein-tyrosine phosphatase
MRTSTSHPIRVDFISEEHLPLSGKLGMTFAPGKKHHGLSGQWDRDLEADLKRLREEWETDILVSLIEEHEFESLGITDLIARAEAHGIRVILHPIRDTSVPTSIEKFAELIDELDEQLSSGKIAVIHCKGGLGRTGLAAACCLISAAGMTTDNAIAAVRSVRPGAIENSSQEAFVEEFSTGRVPKAQELHSRQIYRRANKG